MVRLPYKTIDGTAKAGTDYIVSEDEITISGSIVAADPNNMTEEERVAEMGRPRLGDVPRIEVNITESEDFKVS